MASSLGIHRVTLQRLKQSGYFRDGHHFRKANPLAPRSNTVWHQQRVLIRMNAD
ncbi:DNA-binding protein [Vulcanococcus limneticus]|uniref:DNA-binding protein n=1 Tax=Vulcanococcus limneticus TaxID=2170428 RepID=UPI0018E345A2|nr:DNA-binding protein [Vulcanococcus limneticus]MCP9793280.1 DNA-binding protein [Vulcanococcus limneticus MW73D5]MCP9895255.1 DNA-binding protein [Vulcanococcus limneticus Candia 3F8]MCP9898407.1 DNA-binding protein [Vulcanococcus limneticus Candia 3B3]